VAGSWPRAAQDFESVVSPRLDSSRQCTQWPVLHSALQWRGAGATMRVRCGRNNPDHPDDQVRVLAVICPGLVALGAHMYHPAAPTGSPYTQEQMEVASSPITKYKL
jgi:hypothetical protein